MARIQAMLSSRVVAGAVAGNITVTGIKTTDRIHIVQNLAAVGANLRSEFRISADNTINNTGGTNTTGMTLLVVWEVGDTRGGGYPR